MVILLKKTLFIFISALLLLFSFTQSIAQDKKRQAFKGLVIVIDPGHGGNDPGARTKEIDEDILNLQISLKLKEKLQEMGASVILTRDDDYDLAQADASNIKRSDMQERAKILNQDNVTLFLSIHGNISLDKKCSGAVVYYRIDDENSKQLAQCIMDELKETTSSRYQIKKGDFYLLNNTNTLGVLIETGFLSNSQDLKKLQQPDYQEKLAKSILNGIFQFLKPIL